MRLTTTLFSATPARGIEKLAREQLATKKDPFELRVKDRHGAEHLIEVTAQSLHGDMLRFSVTNSDLHLENHGAMIKLGPLSTREVRYPAILVFDQGRRHAGTK